METQEYEKANEFFESSLNENSEDSYAYLGKLLIDLQLNKIEDLSNQLQQFDKNRNYELAYRFADEALKKTLDNYCNNVIENIQKKLEKEKNKIYSEFYDMFQTATSKEEYIIIIDGLSGFDSDYKDVLYMIESCNNSILAIDYDDALSLEKRVNEIQTEENYNNAISAFELLGEYKDSKEKAILLKGKLEEYLADVAKKSMIEKRKKINIIFILTFVIILIIALLYFVNQSTKYNNAIELYSDKDYVSAAVEFSNLGSFKKSKEYYIQCEDALMNQANSLNDKNNFLDALKKFNQITYNNYFEKINTQKIDIINKILEKKQFDLAFEILDNSNDYNASNILKDKITDNQKKDYTEYIKKEYVIDYSSFENFKSSLKNQLTYINYIDYSDTYTENLNQLSGCVDNIYSANSMLSGYCDYMPEIKDMISIDFEPAKRFLEADFSISYFLIGSWKNGTNSDYSLKFYINDGNISCSSYLPYFDDADYYRIEDNIYSLYDSNDKKLHDVYKFKFTSCDTMEVYCYKDKSTHKLTRHDIIADCDSIFNEVSSQFPYSCEIANDGSYLYFYADPYGLGVGSATSYTASNINDKLGLPDSLYEKMKNTRPIDGTQTESYDDLGLKVSWNYSSSFGLTVLYETI